MYIRKRILRRFQRLLRKSGLITYKDNLKQPESLKMTLYLICANIFQKKFNLFLILGLGYNNNNNNNNNNNMRACMCKCKCAYLLKIKNKGIFRLSGGFKLSLWVISPLLRKSR